MINHYQSESFIVIHQKPSYIPVNHHEITMKSPWNHHSSPLMNSSDLFGTWKHMKIMNIMKMGNPCSINWILLTYWIDLWLIWSIHWSSLIIDRSLIIPDMINSSQNFENCASETIWRRTTSCSLNHQTPKGPGAGLLQGGKGLKPPTSHSSSFAMPLRCSWLDPNFGSEHHHLWCSSSPSSMANGPNFDVCNNPQKEDVVSKWKVTTVHFCNFR